MVTTTRHSPEATTTGWVERWVKSRAFAVAVANDTIGELFWSFYNSTPTIKDGIRLYGQVTNVTATTEEADFFINVMKAGTMTQALQVDGTDLSATFAGIVKHPLGIVSDGQGNGTTVGNARGTGANDFQTNRSAATQVAGGDYSTISGYRNTGSGHYSFSTGGLNTASDSYAVALGTSNTSSAIAAFSAGSGNTASGTYSSVPGGSGNTAGGSYSTASGIDASSPRYGQRAHAAGGFATAGDAQTSVLVARKQTTDATPTELALDGGTTYFTITSDVAYLVEISLIGRKTTANTNGAYTWTGVVVNDGGTTSILGTPSVTVVYEDDAAWDFAVTADDTNDRLAMKVTGVAATTINWVATIRVTEVKA